MHMLRTPPGEVWWELWGLGTSILENLSRWCWYILLWVLLTHAVQLAVNYELSWNTNYLLPSSKSALRWAVGIMSASPCFDMDKWSCFTLPSKYSTKASQLFLSVQIREVVALPLRNSVANTDWLPCRCRKKGQKDQQDDWLQQPLTLLSTPARWKEEKWQASWKREAEMAGQAVSPGSWQGVGGKNFIKAY